MTTPRTTKTVKTADVAAQAQQTVETAIKAGQEAVAKNYDHVVAATKVQVDKASQQLFQGYEEFSAFNKETVDAVLQSGTILTKGFEELSKAALAFAQSSFEVSVATGKAMLGVKTLRELVDLQTEFAKTSFDTAVSEGAKMSELSVKVANEAFEPLNARVNAAVEKFGKVSAAA